MTSPDGPSGGGASGATPAARSWRERVEDPDEPLYTLAVAADLLGMDSQALRRLGDASGCAGVRPSGNQRRYSRTDLEVLASAAELSGRGGPVVAANRIAALELQVAALRARLDG